MNRQAEALKWIVCLLTELDLPYQVVGGLAAAAYGSTRSLVDFDFYVPTKSLPVIAEAAPSRVVRAPTHHRDEHWDLTFMTLRHESQPIELGRADGARYFDRRNGVWKNVEIDFKASVCRKVLGMALPVMPLMELISYKRALDRPVDRQDLSQICAVNDQADSQHHGKS